MKKFNFIIVAIIGIIFCASLGFAQTWYMANQSTVAWDNVSTLSGGDPVPAGDVIKYRVYLKDAISGNPTVVSPSGDIAANEFVITLDTEGSYFVGVSAVRYDSSGVEIGESVIAWSDDPAVCNNNVDFGIRYYFLPSNPVALHRQ